MKILVIGAGGREHALVRKISESKKISRIFCAPGNPGTSEYAENIDLHPDELTKLAEFAAQNKIDLTLVGPEAPLISGIADLFTENNLKIIGPTKRAARLEGSKVYAKKLLLWNKIPTAKFACFDSYEYSKEFLKSQKYPLVIKAEGQCLGKGVAVCKDEKSARSFIEKVFIEKIFKDEGKRIVIEEYLEGQEISFMVATDGTDFVSFLPSQDHKQIYDADRGPNTGGMGAYAPVPFVDRKLIRTIENEIVKPILKALREHDNIYKGILYPGLILTRGGPKVLEFNCRFGDPETQPLMALLKSDIVDIFEAIINNRIRDLKVRWHKGSSVCVILASRGYPGKYGKGKIIKGLDNYKKNKNVSVFQAGTQRSDGHIVTAGGRVLGITSKADNLKKAIDEAYKAIGKKGIRFDGMQFRRDIGKKGLKKSLWK